MYKDLPFPIFAPAYKPKRHIFSAWYGPDGSGKTRATLRAAFYLANLFKSSVFHFDIGEGGSSHYYAPSIVGASDGIPYQSATFAGETINLDLITSAINEIAIPYAQTNPDTVFVFDSVSACYQWLVHQNNEVYAYEVSNNGKPNTISAWARTKANHEDKFYRALKNLAEVAHVFLTAKESLIYEGVKFTNGGVDMQFRKELAYIVDFKFRCARTVVQEMNAKVDRDQKLSNEKKKNDVIAVGAHHIVSEKNRLSRINIREDGTIEETFPLETGTVFTGEDAEKQIIDIILGEFDYNGSGPASAAKKICEPFETGYNREQLLDLWSKAKDMFTWPVELRVAVADRIAQIGQDNIEPSTTPTLAASTGQPWRAYTINTPSHEWEQAIDTLTTEEEFTAFTQHAAACDYITPLTPMLDQFAKEIGLSWSTSEVLKETITT